MGAEMEIRFLVESGVCGDDGQIVWEAVWEMVCQIGFCPIGWLLGSYGWRDYFAIRYRICRLLRQRKLLTGSIPFWTHSWNEPNQAITHHIAKRASYNPTLTTNLAMWYSHSVHLCIDTLKLFVQSGEWRIEWRIGGLVKKQGPIKKISVQILENRLRNSKFFFSHVKSPSLSLSLSIIH